MRDDPERLRDILDAIDRIARYTGKGRSRFESDELVQTWVIHHLEILGEAARAISTGFRERHPELPWREMVGLRNVLAHGYFGIDVDRVWATVTRDLPDLRRKTERILADPDEGE